MLRQPFALNYNQVFAITRNDTVCCFDLDKQEQYPFGESQEVFHSYEYVDFRGVAYNPNFNELLVCDYIDAVIYIAKFKDEQWECQKIPWGIDHRSPINATYFDGRYWISATTIDCDDAIYTLDPMTRQLEILPITYGVSPPDIQSYGYPVLLTDGVDLVFYCKMMPILQWVNRQMNVQNIKEFPVDTVVGPSLNGIVYAFLQEDTWEVWQCLPDKREIKLCDFENPKWDSLDGICLDGNGNLWICEPDDQIHLLEMNSNTWVQLQ